MSRAHTFKDVCLAIHNNTFIKRKRFQMCFLCKHRALIGTYLHVEEALLCGVHMDRQSRIGVHCTYQLGVKYVSERMASNPLSINT